MRHGVRLLQHKQALGRTRRLRRHIVRQLRFILAHFNFSSRLAEPFPQGANCHIQISGDVLNAACTSLPDYGQGLLLEFN